MDLLDLFSQQLLEFLGKMGRDTVSFDVPADGAEGNVPVLVVDEDYRECGLSGEVGAIALEAGIRPVYATVCLEGTLPFARRLEAKALPNAERITAAARKLSAAN